MKREIRYRSTVATALAIVILLGTPVYGRAKKEKNKSTQPGIVRLVLWVQSRLTPPMPEPDPDPATSTDTTGTEVPTTTT